MNQESTTASGRGPAQGGRIKAWVRSHRTEIILFCVSFFIHLIVSVFLFAKFSDHVLFFENEDAYGYVGLAESIAGGQGFSRYGVPSAVRTPVYPLFLSLPLFVGFSGFSFTWSVLILQNIVASLAGVFLFYIGKILFSRRVGLIAGVIYVLEPYMLMTANLGTTETLFNFLVIAGVYAFVRFIYGNYSWRPLVLSGIVFGLATLTRPVAQYIPLLFLCLFISLFFLKKIRLKQTFLFFGIWFISFFAILSPWLIRQYGEFGRVKLTNIDAVILYSRIAPIVVSETEHISYVEAIQKLNQTLRATDSEYNDEDVNNNFKHYDYMVDTTKMLIAEYPGVVAKYYALSLIPALTGTGYEYMLEEVLNLRRSRPRPNFTELLLRSDVRGYIGAVTQLDVFQLVLLGGAGLWVLAYILIFWSVSRRVVWHEHGIALLIILLFAGYFLFFSLGPQIHARYRMPTFPFLYLLIAFAYERSFRRHTGVQ